MKLTRIQKEELVNQMTADLENFPSVILVNFQGLKVKEIQDLKKRCSEQGIGFQIVKNTLLKIALKNNRIDMDKNLFDQPLAIIWSKTDEAIPAKILVSFAKEAESLKIVAGIFDKSQVQPDLIRELASLPSREELFGKLVGTLNAPINRLLNALQDNLRSLVYILKQYQGTKS